MISQLISMVSHLQGKYGVLVSNGKTYLHHQAVSDTTAAAAVAAPADTGKDVSKAGSTVQIAGGDAIAVPARSALLLGPTAVMSEPDNPDNPNNPDNPDSLGSSPMTASQVATTHIMAPTMRPMVRTTRQPHMAVRRPLARRLQSSLRWSLCCSSPAPACYFRIHSPHERTLNRQETSA